MQQYKKSVCSIITLIIFPRYTEDFEGHFLCTVINVITLKNFAVRAGVQVDAYEEMHAVLRSLYWDETPPVEPIPLEDLIEGRSVIIRQSYSLYRGEIVSVDDEGYAEVFLVDYGETTFFPANILYEVSALLAVVPALYLTCALRGLDPIEEYPHAVAMLAGTAPKFFWGEIQFAGVEGEPTVVVLRGARDVDFAAYLAGHFEEEEIVYEELFADEGFEEGPP